MPTNHCPICGYNLTGLTESRCPECGNTFDLRQVRMLQRVGITNRSLLLQLFFVPAGFALMFYTCFFLGIPAMDPLFALMLLGWMLLVISIHAFPLARAHVRTFQVKHRRKNIPWLYRATWPLTLLFILVESSLTFVYVIMVLLFIIILSLIIR